MVQLFNSFYPDSWLCKVFWDVVMPLPAYGDRGCSSTHLRREVLEEWFLPSKLPNSEGYLNSRVVPKYMHLCFPEEGPQLLMWPNKGGLRCTLCCKWGEAVTCLYSSPTTNRQIANCPIWSEIITWVYFKTKAELCTARANSFKREGLLLNPVHIRVCK